MNSYIAMQKGDDWIPLWKIQPSIANILHNRVICFLQTNESCIVLFENDNGTCLVCFNGIMAYAVTACLTKIT